MNLMPFTILGLVIALAILATLLLITGDIIAKAIRDTRKWNWGVRMPLIFLGNLLDQIQAKWDGINVENRPAKLD